MMNQIQLAIAKAVNAPVKKFDPEAHIRAEAEARKRREERRIEQYIHKQWLEVPGGNLPHDVKGMLIERFDRLFKILENKAEPDSYPDTPIAQVLRETEMPKAAIKLIRDRKLLLLPPLKLQAVLARYR